MRMRLFALVGCCGGEALCVGWCGGEALCVGWCGGEAATGTRISFG